MFNWVVNYLGFLRYIPLFPHFFDGLLKIQLLFKNPKVFDLLDEIETEILSWNNTNTSLHKFGGIQFNLYKIEIGHIHGNGLLDILFSKKLKSELIQSGKANEHHIFKESGWISFLIKSEEDKKNALELLLLSFQLKNKEVQTSTLLLQEVPVSL